MPQFKEGSLQFDFGKGWHVFKLDDHRDYREKLEKVDGSKAVDFLAIFERELYLIEVKDFRGHRIENKARLSTGKLAIEVAQKVRDSLACIVGAYHTFSEREDWQKYMDLLYQRDRRIKVVLWLEEDLPPIKQKSNAIAQIDKLEQKLDWLTRRIFVCGINKRDLPDVIVTNLARS